MKFEIKTTIPATPEQVYSAWLSSKSHSEMTGGEAKVSDQLGDDFNAWDGYIEGKNLELEANKRILQAWRTSEFMESDEDSILEILLRDINGQTELTLIHSNLPEHGEQYKKGWEDSYFTPMRAYFSRNED